MDPWELELRRSLTRSSRVPRSALVRMPFAARAALRGRVLTTLQTIAAHMVFYNDPLPGVRPWITTLVPELHLQLRQLMVPEARNDGVLLDAILDVLVWINDDEPTEPARSLYRALYYAYRRMGGDNHIYGVLPDSP